MKNIDQMTPDELRQLADQKEQESIPKKEGFLKYDLYNFYEQFSGYPPGRYQIPRKYLNFWLFTKKQQDDIIKEFIDSFQKVLEKGARFVCFIEDGKAEWYDDVGYGVEGMDDDWANKYLENIKDITKINNA